MTMARLDDAQREELLRLTRKVDAVEMKLTIPSEDHASTLKALGIDPVEAEIRQVWFFDTPDLRLDAAGIVVRARRMAGGKGDTVVKIRPATPDELPKEVRKSGSCKVEVDVMPGRFVCSASLVGRASSKDVRRTAFGKAPLSELLSKEQASLFAERAPAGVTLDDLVALGPILVLRAERHEDALDRDLVAEAWFYPDGARILELSTKSEPDEAFQAGAEARAFLVERGVSLDAEQETKTRTALERFARRQETAHAAAGGATPTA
jgi:hypothetical protein